MGLTYRQQYDENGNVLDPSFWVEDNNELAGTFNGNLDRDNFASGDIAATEVVYQAFNQLHSSATDTSFAPVMATTDWQGGEGTAAAGIDSLTWTSTQDAHFDVHWSGTWSWNGAASNNDQQGAAAASRTVSSIVYDEFDTIEFRVSIDGSVVAVAGPFDDNADFLSTSLVGSIQLPAGVHTLRVEARMFRRTFPPLSSAENGSALCTNTVSIDSRATAVLERIR